MVLKITRVRNQKSSRHFIYRNHEIGNVLRMERNKTWFLIEAILLGKSGMMHFSLVRIYHVQRPLIFFPFSRIMQSSLQIRSNILHSFFASEYSTRKSDFSKTLQMHEKLNWKQICCTWLWPCIKIEWINYLEWNNINGQSV